jgi:hypothetical protein
MTVASIVEYLWASGQWVSRNEKGLYGTIAYTMCSIVVIPMVIGQLVSRNDKGFLWKEYPNTHGNIGLWANRNENGLHGWTIPMTATGQSELAGMLDDDDLHGKSSNSDRPTYW